MSLPPPEPYEHAFLADLKRLLCQITSGNGFHTEAGKNVYLADERLDPVEGEIQLILHDGEEQLIRQDGYLREVNLLVDVEIFVPVSSDAKARADARITARKVMSDVRTALLQGLRGDSFKSRPIDLKLEGRTIFPLENGSKWQLAMQPVRLYTREEFQSV